MTGELDVFAHSESLGQLGAALCKAQGAMGTVVKDRDVEVRMKSGGTYRFSYADLATGLEEVRGPLKEHGLSVIQSPIRMAGVVQVVTMLLHESGEWQRSTMTMPAGNDPKEIGSAITYARRYALFAVLGLATEDDDGQAAGRKRKGAAAPAALPKASHPALVRAFQEVEIGPEALARYLGHSLEEITEDEVEELVALGKAIRNGSDEAREQIVGPASGGAAADIEAAMDGEVAS